MNIICFHNPNEENGYLSNWYPTHFSVDGYLYLSDDCGNYTCLPMDEKYIIRVYINGTVYDVPESMPLL